MTNFAAAQRAVELLGDEPRYAGIREAALRLAEVVDENPGNASLWREYLNVLRDIWEAGRDGDDDLDAFLDGLAEMGNAGDSGH